MAPLCAVAAVATVEKSGAASAAPRPSVATAAMASFGSRDVLYALKDLAKTLTPVPGRKTVIFITAGFPLTPEIMQKQVPDLVASRKRIMPKPELWEPLIRELDLMYRAPVFVKQEEIRAIQAPTLIMAGDHDYYNRADHMVDIYRLLPKGQLALIPGCGHVVLACKADFVIGIAAAFLDEREK